MSLPGESDTDNYLVISSISPPPTIRLEFTGGRYAVSLESAGEALDVLATLRAASVLATPETPATLYGR